MSPPGLTEILEPKENPKEGGMALAQKIQIEVDQSKILSMHKTTSKS